jgi:hypothetical protein
MTPLSSDKWILSSFITATVQYDDNPVQSEFTPVKDVVEIKGEEPKEEPKNDE